MRRIKKEEVAASLLTCAGVTRRKKSSCYSEVEGTIPTVVKKSGLTVYIMAFGVPIKEPSSGADTI